MNPSIRDTRFRIRPLAAGIVLALVTGPAQAFPFQSESGEFKGSFDTTLSAGASWRMEKRDPALVGIANGGTARDVNSDDGNLNYDNGDAVYSAIKATHDLELSYRNYGMFARGTYFYDPANANNDFLGAHAEDRMVAEANLLDALKLVLDYHREEARKHTRSPGAVRHQFQLSPA